MSLKLGNRKCGGAGSCSFKGLRFHTSRCPDRSGFRTGNQCTHRSGDWFWLHSGRSTCRSRYVVITSSNSSCCNAGVGGVAASDWYRNPYSASLRASKSFTCSTQNLRRRRSRIGIGVQSGSLGYFVPILEVYSLHLLNLFSFPSAIAGGTPTSSTATSWASSTATTSSSSTGIAALSRAL